MTTTTRWPEMQPFVQQRREEIDFMKGAAVGVAAGLGLWCVLIYAVSFVL